MVKSSEIILFVLFVSFIPVPLCAEIYGVTCADGTHHPPGFDCKAYIRAKTSPGTDNGVPQARSDKGRQQWEAEQKRQWQQQLREKNERKKREEERRRQFEQDGQKAPKMLKSGTSAMGATGVTGGTPALKTTRSDGTRLKEPLFSKGYRGSAPPYLGDLDSKWPVVAAPSKVQDGTSEALLAANRRTHLLLDALEANPGNWEGSIRYLQNRLMDSPDDSAVRDALNLVRGYYQGYLGAKMVGDNYYKYGVRKWLEGNFDQAARSFARAYRENPEDKLLLRSFAHSLGLRNNSGQCKKPGACSFFDIPEKSIFDDIGSAAEIRKWVKETRAAVVANPENLELRANLNYLEGLAGYDDYLDIVLDKKTAPLTNEGRKAIEAGLKKLGTKDYIAGWKKIAKAWGKHADDRMLLFAVHYAKGLAASQSGETENVPEELWDERTSEVYDKFLEDCVTELLRSAALPEADIEKTLDDILVREALVPVNTYFQQIKNAETENPFFGVLSKKELKELQEKWASFFR